MAWNQTAQDYPHNSCVHELFEAQVERSPEAVAATFDDRYITYRELNARANQLAHHLATLGVGPEIMVGVGLERSIEMLIAVLGILKAGGAYVPLDPTYPPERLAFLLEDSQVPVIVSEQRLAPRFPDSKAHPVWLDSDSDSIRKQVHENPKAGATPDNLAYLIYTSGSTGVPKGAMIVHRGLVNYLHWATKRYAAAEGIGAPVQSPLGFDLTITSLFLPLLSGRTVCLLPEAPDVLTTAVREHRDFSLIKLTPSYLDILSRQLTPAEAVGAARTLVIGGEALTAGSIAFWRKHAPETRLFNEYGPTETVVGCSVYEVTPDTPDTGQAPIGKPIANTQLHVLDEQMRPVRIGATGELYVGGIGVCRGYWRRPELTAKRFIADPFSAQPGARLYRTGDLARWRADGNLEFLGRMDDQIKYRGNRIELAEIEETLKQHPQIREAAAVLCQDNPHEHRLLACVVPHGSLHPSPRELRQFLRTKLPEFMVPSGFAYLDELPLSPSGKVDRRSLAGLPASVEDLEACYTAPRDMWEEQIAEIWSEILRQIPIGVQDDFFERGGDSIRGVRLIARIRDVFGLEVPLQAIYRWPTIGQLVAALQHGDSATRFSSLIPIQPMNSQRRWRPFFCLPGAHGGDKVMFGFMPKLGQLAQRMGPDYPFYALCYEYPRGVGEESLTIEFVAASLLAEIQKVQPHGPYHLGGWSSGGVVALEISRQLIAKGESVPLLALIDAKGPDNSAAGWRQRVNTCFKTLLRRARDFLYPNGRSENLFAKIAQIENSYMARLAPFPGRITNIISGETAAADDAMNNDQGWRKVAVGGIDTHVVAGGHHTMFDEPGISEIAEVLRGYFSAEEAREAPGAVANSSSFSTASS